MKHLTTVQKYFNFFTTLENFNSFSNFCLFKQVYDKVLNKCSRIDQVHQSNHFKNVRDSHTGPEETKDVRCNESTTPGGLVF